TTLPGCGAAGSFDSIACRVQGLADRVERDVRPSSLRDNLIDTLEGGALANVRRAQSQANGGSARRARPSLENADRDLAKFVQRLKRARRPPPIPRAGAAPPAAEARGIRGATDTLAGTL